MVDMLKDAVFVFPCGIANVLWGSHYLSSCIITENNRVEVEVALNRGTERNSMTYKCMYMHCSCVFLCIIILYSVGAYAD